MTLTKTKDMDPSVKKLYKQAVSDKRFYEDLKDHETSYSKPEFLWPTNLKVLYASIYMGWLIAKGEYDENDFANKTN